LQAAQAELEQQVKRMAETLAEETRRRQGAELQAGEIGKRRIELEAELANNQQVASTLRQELECIAKHCEPNSACDC